MMVMNDKFYQRIAKPLIVFILLLVATSTFAQVTISGTIKDSEGNPLSGVVITDKKSQKSTQTNQAGKFSFEVPGPLLVKLIVYKEGFVKQEVTANELLVLVLTKEAPVHPLNTQVYAASRATQRLLDVPVSIETMSSSDIRQSATGSFYNDLANFKGVHMMASSLLIQSLNARGFGSTNQTSLVQRLDGVDLQSPFLNAPLGNLAGTHDLDVDRVEFQAGAASALYGSGATQGILNVYTKNPFDHQGLTVQLKSGVNNVNQVLTAGTKLYYETALRYAKAINDKLAFKVNFAYLNAEDWRANDQRSLIPVQGSNTPNFLWSLDDYQVGANALNTYGNRPVFSASLGALYRTGYSEYFLVDNQVQNIKADVGVYYKLRPSTTLSYTFKYAQGNGMLTEGNRVSYPNYPDGSQIIWPSALLQGSRQHYQPQYFINKLELKNKNFFVRAYHLRENLQEGSFDLYNAALLLQRRNYKADNVWEADFVAAYNATGNLELAQLAADEGRLGPNGDVFKAALNEVKNSSLANEGAAITSQGDVFHVEGQYSFDHLLDKTWSLSIGGSYRLFSVDANAFKEVEGFREMGTYAQVAKSFWKDRLKLGASLRFDKGQYFKGVLTPRYYMLIQPTKNHAFRASYQTGFRNPTLQEQSLFVVVPRSTRDLVLAGGRDGLLGVPHTGQPFITAPGQTDVSQTIPFIEPEKMTTWEVGYRGFLGKTTLLDINYYRSIHRDFIGFEYNNAVANIDRVGLGTFGFYQNLPKEHTVDGLSVGMHLALAKNFQLKANYSWSRFVDGEPTTTPSIFNTPRRIFNVVLTNPEVIKNLGFRIAFRQQSDFTHFLTHNELQVQETVDAYNTIDAQINYRIRKGLVVKIGGSNILNNYYRQALASSNIGGMYYISFTFDTTKRK